MSSSLSIVALVADTHSLVIVTTIFLYSYRGATGDKVKARYTYVYTYEEGEWKIAHHHSSVMPEAFLG